MIDYDDVDNLYLMMMMTMKMMMMMTMKMMMMTMVMMMMMMMTMKMMMITMKMAMMMMKTVMMTMLPSNEVPPAVSKRISLNVNCKLQTSHISCIILCINVSSIIILYASSCYASSYCVHHHIL